MKLILLILPILVIATLGMTVAETPPENVEPSMKKYLTAEEETARWPSQVARDEMGSLMVQRGPGKVVYSLWNAKVDECLLFEDTFMVTNAYVYGDLYTQQEFDEGRQIFLSEFAKKNPVWILILAYDDDTVLPIAYQLNDRGNYERQPADVAKSLVDRTRAPNGKDISLREMAEAFDSDVASDYFCRFYTREGRYIPYHLQSHYTLEASLRELEELLCREKPFYVLTIGDEGIPDCYHLTTDGTYRPFHGPMCEALNMRATRGNMEPPTQATIDEAVREYEEYERRRQAEQREQHTPTSTTDQR